MTDLNRPLDLDLQTVRAVHFVGIGGAGVSPLARLILDAGKRVSGSDQRASGVTAALAEAGASVTIGHAAANLPVDCDLVIISPAVPVENPEVAAALARGIPVHKKNALLGALMRGQTTIAVAGSHGKTTTSTMFAWVLEELGMDPSFVLGGESIDLGTSGRLGTGRYLVAEADEFDGALAFFAPEFAVVTNVEPEHLDYYGSEEALLAAFRDFVRRVPPSGAAVLCIDDLNLRRMADGLRGEGVRVETYGFSADADWQTTDLMPNPWHGYDFSVINHGAQVGRISLGVPGRHNAQNATAVVAVQTILNMNYSITAQALNVFRGVRRRFEERGMAGGVTVIDDYAHHPTEIRATLAAARERFGNARLVVAFQPHLFSRTRLLMEGFASAFEAADAVVLYDIYPARETNRWDVSSAELAQRIGPKAIYAGALSVGVGPIVERAAAGGAVLTLGAGDIDSLVPALLEALER